MSKWQDLVTASLIGTERAVVPRAGIPGLPAVADADGGDPAEVLLDQAALLTAARRAGRRPDRAEPVPAAEPDRRPSVSPAAGRRLVRILGGEHQDLLAEWLGAAAARGLRPPAQLLPALLDRARRPSPAGSGALALRRLVAEVGGSRARWLADLNPEWRFLAGQTGAGDDVWRLGKAGQRRDYLTALRARDPAAARELVAGSWEGAGRDDRSMFLSILADRLELADEPLLETALGDPAPGVRAWAANLLARLPESALSRRMAERAAGCLRIERTPGGPRLVIIPQAVLEDSPGAGARAPGRSQIVSSRLGEIVGRTPLGTWTEAFGLTAARIASLPAGDWAPVLFTGWARAAITQDNQEWMTALIIQAFTGRRSRTPAEVAELRAMARHADPRLGAPGAWPGLAATDPERPPAIRDVLAVLRFRYEMLKELGYEHGDG